MRATILHDSDDFRLDWSTASHEPGGTRVVAGDAAAARALLLRLGRSNGHRLRALLADRREGVGRLEDHEVIHHLALRMIRGELRVFRSPRALIPYSPAFVEEQVDALGPAPADAEYEGGSVDVDPEEGTLEAMVAGVADPGEIDAVILGPLEPAELDAEIGGIPEPSELDASGAGEPEEDHLDSMLEGTPGATADPADDGKDADPAP
jgi:hypothetical protein